MASASPHLEAVPGMQLQSRADPSTARRQLREYLTLADQTTEFIWQLQLRQLRERLPKKDPTQSTALHMPEELHLPEDVQQVLCLGPKFAVEPKKSPPELLSLVREVSRRVPEEDAARCVSEGVDSRPFLQACCYQGHAVVPHCWTDA
ncbi:hypothetical protein HPB47_027332 [Ixodes persulcatus]|uniref:Uncharacterized protein n=1 Tax=Ixodes persulcatus TaxID=34615 RepID=A0AC60PW48_IXOPE|nr:hypothetical protein HPB47_027332 [Ixodes persulcatus]